MSGLAVGAEDLCLKKYNCFAEAFYCVLGACTGTAQTGAVETATGY